jgi:hypothetical protein
VLDATRGEAKGPRRGGVGIRSSGGTARGACTRTRMSLDVTLPTAHPQCAVGVLRAQDNTIPWRLRHRAFLPVHGSH